MENIDLGKVGSFAIGLVCGIIMVIYRNEINQMKKKYSTSWFGIEKMWGNPSGARFILGLGICFILFSSAMLLMALINYR